MGGSPAGATIACVTCGTSSTVVFSLASQPAAAEGVPQYLFPAMNVLDASLARKAHEFADVIKIGRTHLQDAVPMRLGQEFGGYARPVAASRERIECALTGIYELAIGWTAVGTGLQSPPEMS